MADTEMPIPPSGGQALTNFRLEQIEKKIDRLGSDFVPVGIYNVNQANIADSFARLIKADSDETAARESLEKRIDTAREDIDKNRKQFWTSLAVGALLLVVGIFVTPITRALGLTP